MKHQGFKVYRTTALVAFMILIGLAFPAALVHEFGHIIICVVDGNTYELILGVFMAGVVCDGTLSNLTLHYLFGGLFAAMIVSIPLAIPQVRKYRSIVIALLSTITIQLMNAIAEGFFNDWYQKDAMILMLPSILPFFIFLYLFARVKA